MAALAYLGVFVFIIGGIGILIAAFKTSILWGLGCLFIAPVSLIFLILHWDVAKNPFFLQLAGIIIMFAGSSAAQHEKPTGTRSVGRNRLVRL